MALLPEPNHNSWLIKSCYKHTVRCVHIMVFHTSSHRILSCYLLHHFQQDITLLASSSLSTGYNPASYIVCPVTFLVFVCNLLCCNYSISLFISLFFVYLVVLLKWNYDTECFGRNLKICNTVTWWMNIFITVYFNYSTSVLKLQ